MQKSGLCLNLFGAFLLGVHLLCQHAAAQLPEISGVAPQQSMVEAQHLCQHSTAYGSRETAGEQSCVDVSLGTALGSSTRGGAYDRHTAAPVERCSGAEAHKNAVALPMWSRAAARRLQQPGTTTLRPLSATTQCLDTNNIYLLLARLDLAASCTGSVHQLMSLPVPGSDLTIKLLGASNRCLDVAFAGTASPTNAGVSGWMT